MKLRASDYVAAAQQLNTDIQFELNQGRYPLEALASAAEELARKQGWEGWKTVRGKAADADEVPFEVWMPNLALLTATWTCWLYTAKARDRLSGSMRERMADFMSQFVDLYLHSQVGVFVEWDREAWRAIKRDVRSEGSKAAHIHYGFWGDLTWWEKVKVWFRRPKR